MIDAKQVETGVKILDGIGILDRVKAVLFSRREAAAAKLDEVLGYLVEGYQFLLELLIDLTSFRFSDESMAADIQLLKKIVAGSLMVRYGTASVHCGRIHEIYESHLKGWFDRMFKGDEKDKLERLFYNLSYSDDAYIAIIQHLCFNAQPYASELLGLVDLDPPDGQKIKEARKKVREMDKELADSRIKLGEHLSTMTRLQREFHAVLGIP